MELSPKDLMTIGVIGAGVASAWGITRHQISIHVVQIKKAFTRIYELEHRLDGLEATKAKSEAQLTTITQHILSPAILKKQSERDGAIEQRLLTLERETAGIRRMHNDSHPPQKS